MKKELLSEGLLALVVGVDYLVKLCRDGEREERTLPSKKDSSQMDLLVRTLRVRELCRHDRRRVTNSGTCMLILAPTYSTKIFIGQTA